MAKLIISAFPGVGKSYFQKHHSDRKISDSDSSEFSWIIKQDGTKERDPEFPSNYMQHIKSLANDQETQVILVSSHAQVRQALYDHQIQHYLVYPDQSLKDQYIERFKQRNSPQQFIDVVYNNWQNWIQEIDLEFLTDYCKKIKIDKPNTFLTDIFSFNRQQ